jgi:hypothetical protein
VCGYTDFKDETKKVLELLLLHCEQSISMSQACLSFLANNIGLRPVVAELFYH